MSNFNYNNYIGEHMDEPLMVLEPTNLTTELTYKNIGFITESGDHTPKIKSPSDLTDAEWLFVFGRDELKDKTINKWNNEYIEHLSEGHLYNEFNTRLNEFKHCNQDLLNRLYSLHISLDYNKLIENNKAVRKI